jgi:uncharacterized protein (TIGR02678 family)
LDQHRADFYGVCEVTATAQALISTSSAEIDAERRRALRALLRNPLLPAAGETAEAYSLVRRHCEWLKQWFAKFPAWSLHVDREMARLRKLPADHLDETRPAVDRASGTTFTRRRYALLCLALAALEKFNRQTTLRKLAETIMHLVASDRELRVAGLVFDTGNYDQRRDLLHAIRLLTDRGLLHKLDGDERLFLDGNERADVLYEINRHILAGLLQALHSPSTVETSLQSGPSESIGERARRLTEEPVLDTEDGRSKVIRSRLVRVLLDEPVLYFHNLSDEERSYLEKHRTYILRQISDATGLIAEVRAEGIAMVDDAGELTDLALPIDDTYGQLTQLLLQWFAECLRDGTAAIPVSAVEAHVRELIQVRGSEWHKEVRETGAENRLSEDVISRLRALGLVQLIAGGIVPLAACGRYAGLQTAEPEE